jgi:hypothetical protein
MGFWSGIGDVISSATKWIGANKDIIKPIVSAGAGLYSSYQKGQDTQAAIDLQRRQEQERYDKAIQNRNEYLDWYRQKAAYEAQKGGGGGGRRGGGGGGGGGGGAAPGLTAEQYNALKLAMATSGAGYDTGLSKLSPLADTAPALMSSMTDAYGNSVRGANALLAYLTTPSEVAKLNQATPAANVDIQLPDYLKAKA